MRIKNAVLVLSIFIFGVFVGMIWMILVRIMSIWMVEKRLDSNRFDQGLIEQMWQDTSLRATVKKES